MEMSMPALFAKFESYFGAPKPFYVTQDDVSWYRVFVLKYTNYTLAINTGILFWHGQGKAKHVLATLWNSSLDDYGSSPSKYRSRWPMEQEKVTEMVNDPVYNNVSSSIGVLPASPRPDCGSNRSCQNQARELWRAQCNSFARIQVLRLEGRQSGGYDEKCFAFHATDWKGNQAMMNQTAYIVEYRKGL
jgi:hypothetical protein